MISVYVHLFNTIFLNGNEPQKDPRGQIINYLIFSFRPLNYQNWRHFSVIVPNLCVCGLICIYTCVTMHIMIVTTPTETDKDKYTKNIPFKCIVITGVWERMVLFPIVGTSI